MKYNNSRGVLEKDDLGKWTEKRAKEENRRWGMKWRKMRWKLKRRWKRRADGKEE